MSVAFTTRRWARARSRSGTVKVARRDQRPMYGAGAHWACRPASRSIAAVGVRVARSRSNCRARRARFSSRSESARGAATARRLGEPADDPDDLALDLHVPGVDGLHLAVGGLQPDAIALLIEALEGRGVVLEDGDHDLPVACGLLGLDDDVIAVVDVVLDHRLPADPEYERVVPRRELRRKRHRLGPVLVGLDRLPGRDLADDRRAHDLGAVTAGKGEGPRAGGLLLEAAVLLQLGQVVVHGRGRGEPDGLSDLTHARRVPALLDRLADVGEDPLGALLVPLGHRSDGNRTD